MKAGVTLVEVLIAAAIVAVALPTILSTTLTIRRMDSAQLERCQANHLTGAVVEEIHYRMYNGFRTVPEDPATLVDTRGYRLNDARDRRGMLQRQGSPQAFFATLGERDRTVTSVRGRLQSGYYAPLARLASSGNPGGARWLDKFELDVTPVLQRDNPPAPPRVIKNFDEPAVDMAQVGISLSWTNATRGAVSTRALTTRFTRHLYDEDMTHTQIGAPVIW